MKVFVFILYQLHTLNIKKWLTLDWDIKKRKEKNKKKEKDISADYLLFFISFCKE